jgi:hypothetical protein
MNEHDKNLIQELVNYNNDNYNLHKACEELQELSLVLTQFMLKPDKVDIQEIVDEIGDVEIRIEFLKNIFNRKDIQKRVDFKLKKFEEYMTKKMYKNI